jgi:hypothetical protein
MGEPRDRPSAVQLEYVLDIVTYRRKLSRLPEPAFLFAGIEYGKRAAFRNGEEAF